jgi:hypothetical protein
MSSLLFQWSKSPAKSDSIVCFPDISSAASSSFIKSITISEVKFTNAFIAVALLTGVIAAPLAAPSPVKVVKPAKGDQPK